MKLNETIYKRKSIRSYTDVPVDQTTVNNICDFLNQTKRLYPNILTRFEIVGKKDVKCMFSWKPLQYVTFYSQKVDGYLENAGFILQQLDLYLQSIGIGSCWLGLSKPDGKEKSSDGLDFVIMICFGYPKEDFRKDISEFKRRPLEKICDIPDERLEPARFAPSAINSQPWFFTHDGDVIHTFQSTRALRHLFLKELNRIDTGISLAHMYVSNPETFSFFKADPPSISGYDYVGSFKI